MKKMKVLMIEHFGGENLYSYCLCNALCRYEIELTVITTSSFVDSGDNFKVLRFYPAYEKCLKTLKILKYLMALLSTIHIIIIEKFDVIHFQTFRKFNYEWIMFKVICFFCKNTVFTCHNVFPHESTKYKAYIFKQVYRSANRIIVHNNYAYRSLQGILKKKVDKEKIHIIPHGNYEYYLEIAKSCAGPNIPDHVDCLNSKTLELMVFGVMREYKGLEILLKALRSVKDKRVKLFVYGRADAKFQIKHERLASQFNLEDMVTFNWGEVPNENVAFTIKAADIVVFPYKHIYQSGALMLAYTLGKAVMVSAIEGFRQEVIHGKNGYIVNFNNHEEFRNLIYYLMENKCDLEKIGIYNRELSKTVYNWEYIAKLTLEVYKGINK